MKSLVSFLRAGLQNAVSEGEFWVLTPVLLVLAVISLVTDAWSAPAGSHFEVGSQGVQTLRMQELLTSPVFAEKTDEVFARAADRVAADDSISEEARDTVLAELAEMHGAARAANSGGRNRELQELPFKRVLDLTLIFPGIPDVLGLCIEAYPTNNLSIEGCASTAIFLGSLTATVKYRWDLILSETPKGRIHELLLGPGAGIRHVSYLCFDACGDDSIYADAIASLEYNYWFKPHIGLSIQFDAGATVLLGRIDGPYSAQTVPGIIPVGRLSFGLAF
jgi:hypothetical protein